MSDDQAQDAPITRTFHPRTHEKWHTPVGVEFLTADHTTLECGPIRAEFREKDAPPAAACGVTFSHDWHGFLDDDGRTRVCDGEPLPPAST